MAALQTCATLKVRGDFYLCPLPAVQMQPAQLQQAVEEQRHQDACLVQVMRTDEHGQTTCIAQGYETVQRLTALVDGHQETWEERRSLVQSLAASHAAQANLQSHLQQAQQALSELTVWQQGKPRLTERAAVEEALNEILIRFRVESLLCGQVQKQAQERTVRAYRGRLSAMLQDLTFMNSSEREEEVIAQAVSQSGWRTYATNHLTERPMLEQTVEAYCDEHLVKRNFSRLKDRPLSLVPLCVQHYDQQVGLVRQLTIALRMMTLLEGVVRQRLSEQKIELAGLFAGNPNRHTSQPTTERLLEAFSEVTLTIVRASPNGITRLFLLFSSRF